MNSHFLEGFSLELTKHSGVMEDLKAKGREISDKIKSNVKWTMADMKSGSPSGDRTTFAVGNAAAKGYAKAYGRGAMRRVGLDPDNPVHTTGAQVAGLAAAAIPLARMRSTSKKHKARDARLKELESQLAQEKKLKAAKSKILDKIKKLKNLLRRGR